MKTLVEMKVTLPNGRSFGRAVEFSPEELENKKVVEMYLKILVSAALRLLDKVEQGL